jgi:hypothetical protein
MIAAPTVATSCKYVMHLYKSSPGCPEGLLPKTGWEPVAVIGGRPPALDAIKVRAAKAMLASGTMTASAIPRQVGCSASTLYRHVPGGRAAVAEGQRFAPNDGVRLRLCD